MAGLLMLLDLDTSYPLLLILTSGALLLPLLHTAGPVPAAALSKGPLPSAAAAPAAAGYLRFGNFPSLVASIPGVAVMASVLLHTLMQSAYFLGLLALDLFLAACLQMQLGATLWSPAKQQQLKAGDSSSCSRHQRNPSGGGSSGHALPQMLNMCMRLLPKAITASLPLLAGVTQVVAASDTLVTPVSSTSDALLIMLAMAWSSSLYQVPLAVQLPLSLVEWLLLFYAHGAPFTSGAARLASTTGANTSILQHIWYSVLAVLISTVASKSALVNSLRTSVMSGMTQLLAGAGMLSPPHPSSSPAAAGDGGRPRQRMHRLSHSSNSSLGTSSYRDSSEEPRGSVELEKYKSCSTAQFDEDVADSWRCGAGRCGSQSSRTTADTTGSAHPLQPTAISSSRSLSSNMSLGQASSGAAEVSLGAAGGEGAAAAMAAAQLAPAGSDVQLHGTAGVTGGVTSGTRVTTPLPEDVDVSAMKQEVHDLLDQDVQDVSSGLAMQRSSSASSILSFDASALAALAAGQHGPSTPGGTSAAEGRSASFHATGPGSYEAHAPTAAAGPSKATAAERFLQSLVNTCGPTGGTTTTNPAAAAPPAPPAAAVGAHRSRYMSQHLTAAPAVPASPCWGLAASNGAVTDDSAYAPPMGNLSPPGAAATNSNSSSVPGMATVAAADLLAAAAGHVSATGHPAAAAAGVHEVTNISPQQVVADLSSTIHPSPAPQAVPWSTLARHPVTPTPGYTGYSVAGSGMRATGAASSRGTSSSSSHMGAHNAAGATAAAAAQRQAAGRSAALRAVAATMGEEFASSLEGVSDAALAQLPSGGTVKERLLMPYTSVTQLQPVGCKVYSPGSYGFDTISHLLTTSLHHSAAAATGGSAYITSTCVSGCVQLLGAVLSPAPNAQGATSTMQLAATGGRQGSKDAAWLAAFENAVTAGVGTWAHLDQLPPPEVVLQPVQAPASHQQQQQRMTQHQVAPKAGDAAHTGAVAQLHGSFPCSLAAGQDQLVTLVISIDPQRLGLLQQQQAASHARLQAVAAARVAAVASQGPVPSAAAEAAAQAAAPLLANEALAATANPSSSSSSSSGVVGKAGNASGSPSGVEWRMVVHQAGAAVLDVEVKLEEGSAGLQAIRLPLPALSHGAATISLLAGQSHVAVTSILPVLPAPAAEEVNATWQQLSRFDSALYSASGVASSQLSSKATQSPVAVWGEVMAPFMQDVAYTAGQLSSGNTAAAAAVLQAVLQGAASLGCWQLVEYLVNQHQRYKAAAEDTVDRTISSEQDSSGAAGLQPNQFAAERSASSFTSTASSKGRSAVSNVTLPTIAASSSGGSSSGSCCTSPFAAYAHQGGCFGALGDACSGAMPSSTTLVGLQHGNTAPAASVDRSFTALLSDPSTSMGQRQRSQLSNSSSLGQGDMESRRRSSSAMNIGTPDLLLSPGGSRDLLSTSMRLNSSSSSAASSSKDDQLWRIPVKGLPGLQLQRSTSVDSGLSVHFSKHAKGAAVTAATAAGLPCPGGLLEGAGTAAEVAGVPVKAASCASPQQRLLMEAFLMLQFASTTVMCFQQQLTTASPGDTTHTSSSGATGPLVKTMASLLLLSPPALLLGGRFWLPPALQQVVTAACVAAGPLVVLVQPSGGVLQTAVAVVQYGAAAPLILQGPMRLAAALLVVELVALCIGTWCLGQHLAAFEAAVAGAAATAATALLFTLHADRAAPGPAADVWGGAVRAGV